MTLKPPTKTFPKLVMKEWPEREQLLELAKGIESDLVENGWRSVSFSDKALSDFTRVLEGVQGKSQKEKSRDE